MPTRTPASRNSTKPNSTKSQGRTQAQARSRTQPGKGATQAKSPSLADFEFDPEVLDPDYNQLRKPRLPYGIIVNDNPAGILIPMDQLESAGWLDLPEDLDEVVIGENTVAGLFLTECRMAILAKVQPYIRYKDADQLKQKGADENLSHAIVGLYETHQTELDKALMETCSEHAIVFLDNDDQPLHNTPVVVRFKNVALWSLTSACEEYYRKAERAFAELAGQPYSGKSDKWRSLVVLPITFTAEKEGKGKNKSTCCKTAIDFAPTAENLPEIFLGTPQGKATVWGFHEEILGFAESAPALAPAQATQALPDGVVAAKEDDLQLGDEDEEFDPDEAIEVDVAIVDEDDDNYDPDEEEDEDL